MIPLPPLQNALLDSATLAALFRDLGACTTVLEIRPKYAAEAYAPQETLDLAAAEAGLRQGQYRGVQIRYVHEDRVWIDTLMTTPQGIRLVRLPEPTVAE